MTDLLPRSLIRMKRGICPRCGLPLPLDDDAPTVRCAACGCSAVLERRLRTTEPELPGTPLRMEWGHDQDPHQPLPPGCGPWVRSAQFRQGDLEQVHCPGCGIALEKSPSNGEVDVLRCATCGTDTRFEQRLVAVRSTDSRPTMPRARDADEPPNLDSEADDDPETEHLLWRIASEQDVETRIALALNLRRWRFINRTLARFAPALVAAMHRTPRDPRLEQAIADGLGQLLNEGNDRLRDAVLIAAEPWLFRRGSSRALIATLGLGSPVGLKLLLDSAEWAVRQGDDPHAAACLHAVNLLFQRNFEAHESMGEVLLYRTLYLTGPTLAFALGVAQRRITGTGFHFKAPTLLRFLDDAAAERATLVGPLQQAMYVGPPEDQAGLAQRLDLHRSLRSEPAKITSLGHHLRPPKLWSEEAAAALVRQAVATLDDPASTEALRQAADACLCGLLQESPQIPQAVHDLVAARRDALPSEVRRRYLALCPDTPHLDQAQLPYWQSPKPAAESSEVAEAIARWNAALRDAVDEDLQRREALREFWSERAGSPEAAAMDVR